MNPLVEEMLTAKNRQDLEIAMLEELLTGDVKCEGKEHGGKECVKEVVYLFECCIYRQLICQNRAQFVQDYYAGKNGRCRDCGNPTLTCWTITPI